MGRHRLTALFFSVLMVVSMVAVGTAVGGIAGSDHTEGTVAEIPEFDEPDDPVDFGADVETEELTLVTGHTVTVLGSGDERQFLVEDADGERAQYRAVEQKTGTYLVPSGVDFSVFSKELFNIDLLLEQGYADDELEGTPVVVTYSDERYLRGPSTQSLEDTTTLEAIDAKAGVATGESDLLSERSLRGVKGVYLDAQFEVQLDESTDAIDGPSARDEFDVSGNGTTVAVLDTGVDHEHPDFGDRVVDRVDFTGDGLGDRQGHGTHVAGIVAGDGTEDSDYVGVAPEADLMDVKVLDDAGSGSLSDIAEGVDYAVDNGADIVSMSLGGPEQESDPLTDAVEDAVDEGVTVITSAGNSGTELQTISSPAVAEDSIAVGATEEPYDEIAEFSSSGPTQIEQLVKPEIVAPGIPITAAGSDDAGEFPYTAKGGTSMSAPHVSGLAALMIEEHGELDPAETRDRLITTADPLDGDFEDDVFRQGAGQVNATSALGSEIIIHDAVKSFGTISEATTETAVYPVENIGDESVTLDGEASTLNIDEGEEVADAELNQTSVTVDPGETEYVELSVNTTDAFGQNSGTVTFEDDDGENYEAIFGFSKGLEITVEKEFNDKNEDHFFTEALQTYATDGTFQDFTFEAFIDKTDYSFILPASEQELGFFSIAEYEDTESGDIEGAYAVKEDVVVNQSNDHVVIDETETVVRDLDTSAVSDDEPFDVLSYQANIHVGIDMEPAPPAFFLGGFGEQAHYTPLDEDSVTNVSTNYLMVPDEGDELDSPRVYSLVGTTETISEDGEPFVVDPDTFAEEEMTLYSPKDEEYEISSFFSAVDQDRFPGQLPIATPDSVGDRSEMTWIRSADGLYENVFRDGDTSEFRYVGINWSPEVNETVDTEVNAEPLIPNADWSIDDRLDIRAAWAADQGDTRLATRGQGSVDTDEIRVELDGDTVIDEEVPDMPEVGIDGPVGPDTDVVVELDGNSLEQNRSISTSAMFAGNSDDEAPPNIESVDVQGYAPNETITENEVTLEVEVSSEAGLDRRMFRAYYGHDTNDRPTEDWTNWARATPEYVGGNTYYVDVHIDDDADHLDIAFRALDLNRNELEVATAGAVPVDIDDD